MEHPSEFHRLLRNGGHRPRRRLTGEAFRPSPRRRVASRGQRHLLLNMVVAGAVIGFTAPTLMAEANAPAEVARADVRFGYCHAGGGMNCVVDGDTFWMHGQRVRIADIDTPETHPPRCAEEERLGFAAGRRLQDLLNAGPVTLSGSGEDRYGRLLRTVERDGVSLGDVLVSEGLARPYGGGRRGWCWVA